MVAGEMQTTKAGYDFLDEKWFFFRYQDLLLLQDRGVIPKKSENTNRNVTRHSEYLNRSNVNL
jgi:hypothetical protein